MDHVPDTRSDLFIPSASWRPITLFDTGLLTNLVIDQYGGSQGSMSRVALTS